MTTNPKVQYNSILAVEFTSKRLLIAPVIERCAKDNLAPVPSHRIWLSALPEMVDATCRRTDCSGLTRPPALKYRTEEMGCSLLFDSVGLQVTEGQSLWRGSVGGGAERALSLRALFSRGAVGR